MIPSHPLFRRFENEFEFRWPYDQRDVVIEWTIRDSYIFWREVGLEEDLLWICPVQARIHDYFARRRWWGEKERIENINEFFLDVLRYGTMRRFCVLPTGQELFLGPRTVKINVPNSTYALSIPLPQPLFAPYRKSQRLLFASADELDLALTHWRQESESVLEWALQRIQETFDCWSLVVFEQGEQEEYQRLIHSLVVLFCHTNPSSRPFQFIARHRRSKTRLQTTKRHVGDCIPDRFVEQLNAHFVLKRHPLIQFAYGQHWYSKELKWVRPNLWTLPHWDASEASQHERLEALLVWREFLRDKLSPEEIEALLKI